MNTPHRRDDKDFDFDWVTAQRGWEAFQRLHGGNPKRSAGPPRLPRSASRADAVALVGEEWMLSPRLCEDCGRRGAEDSETLGRALCGRCWKRAFFADPELPPASEIEEIALEGGLEVVDRHA